MTNLSRHLSAEFVVAAGWVDKDFKPLIKTKTPQVCLPSCGPFDIPFRSQAHACVLSLFAARRRDYGVRCHRSRAGRSVDPYFIHSLPPTLPNALCLARAFVPIADVPRVRAVPSRLVERSPSLLRRSRLICWLRLFVQAKAVCITKTARPRARRTKSR